LDLSVAACNLLCVVMVQRISCTGYEIPQRLYISYRIAIIYLAVGRWEVATSRMSLPSHSGPPVCCCLRLMPRAEHAPTMWLPGTVCTCVSCLSPQRRRCQERNGVCGRGAEGSEGPALPHLSRDEAAIGHWLRPGKDRSSLSSPSDPLSPATGG
jgi:hypothetical protein